MTRLTARFNIDLPNMVLVEFSEELTAKCKLEIGEFEVEIQFITNGQSTRRFSPAPRGIHNVQAINIFVTRDEGDEPPRKKFDETSGRDFSELNRYFDDRIEAYGEIASLVTNRLIRFFKYVLKTPNLLEISENNDCFRNASWTDESGNDYSHGGTFHFTVILPIIADKLGRKVLSPSLAPEFERAIVDPITPTLHEEILSDAQTALHNRDLRRAILEMAIACEIAVKRKYFAEDSPAGAAFDYLEDRSRVSVRVLDLIDGISLEAFGKSFRKQQPGDFRNIDHLFRCRNKIAHRGELSFRNDAARWVEVDSKLVTDWWKSVLVLFEWIDDL